MFNFILCWKAINFRWGYSFRENEKRNTYEITERTCSMIRKVMIKRKTPKRRKFLNRTQRSRPRWFVASTVIVSKLIEKYSYVIPKENCSKHQNVFNVISSLNQ